MTEESGIRLPALYGIAKALIFSGSRQETLREAVEALSKALNARNAIFWTFSPEKSALTPEVTVLTESVKTRNVSRSADFLGETYRSNKPLILSGEEIQQYKHFQFSEGGSAESVLCFPFRGRKELEGILEFINRSGAEKTFTQRDSDFVKEALELIAAAVRRWAASEDQTHHQLNAITRLTLLYDISQIFHSTLEMNELLPVITEKIRDIQEAETCTIWVKDESGEKFQCSHSAGGYSEFFQNFTARLDEDPAGEAIKSGEGILLEDASQEERLLKRLKNPEETPLITYMNAPLVCREKILGVLEVMNRVEGEAYFNEEDHFLLNELAQQAAASIYNANLLATERKAQELDALLKVSHEITSTLDLNHVLLSAVNHAAGLIAFDRASIALVERGKVQISAVSGQMEVDRKSSEMRELGQILEWAADLKKGLYISELNGVIATDNEEQREKFKAYFERTGFKTFVSIPLKDEEGELGVLCFESAQPYFMDERHLEVSGILSNHLSVAIRNAQLYRQVPLLDLMKPIMKKKAEILKMPRNRKIAWLGGAAVLALLLAIVPWNMAVQGNVTVLPWLRTGVVSEVEGIIRDVKLREGDIVQKGKAVATLVDEDYKLAIERYQTRKDMLLREISRSESAFDATSAQLKRIELEQMDHEIRFSADQLARTQLVAPVNGVIVTPRIEEKAGLLIRKGEEFCEIADMKTIRAEIALDEVDVSHLKAGQKVAVKMNSYPTSKFYGEVKLLGATLQEGTSGNHYVVQAEISDPQVLLKQGMVGKAKIETGSHSVGYVLLRKPFYFLWKKLWVWLP